MSDDDYVPVEVNTPGDINVPDSIHLDNITSATQDINISESVTAPDNGNITDNVPVPDKINVLGNGPVPDDIDMVVSVPISNEINMPVSAPVSDQVNTTNITNAVTTTSLCQSDIPAETTLLQNEVNTLVEADSTSNNDHTLLSSTMANDTEPQLSSVRVTRKRRRKFFIFTDMFVNVRKSSWDLPQQRWPMIHG